MKILHVIANLAPRYGGPSKVCQEICKVLADYGEDVTIYTTDRDYPDGRMNVQVNKPVSQDGYTVCYFPVQFLPYMLSVDMAKALRGHLSEFDVVHIHGLYRFPYAATAYYARRYGVPYIISPHGSLDPYLFNRRRHRLVKRTYEYLIEFRNLNNAAAIHFTTAEEMSLTKSLKLKAPGIVVPIGLDLNQYQGLPSYGNFRKKINLGNKKIILHFGRINFKKGLDILVKAFAQVSRQRDDLCLVIAGPDNEGYGKQVEKWLIQEGVRDKAIFTGMLQGVDKLSVLRDADMFVLPSYSENFGISVVEAMACGVPVMISDKVNIWREVAASGAGRVASCDADCFAEMMSELLDDPRAGKQMGERGKALVKERYQWSNVVLAMEDAYRSIISSASVS